MGEILAKKKKEAGVRFLWKILVNVKLEKDVLIVSVYLWTMQMRKNVKMDPMNPL